MKKSLWATTLYESKELVVLCYEHGKCYEPEQKPACCFSNGGQLWAPGDCDWAITETGAHSPPHPTDWPTQTSKDFHLGTCILMGGNWSPGQSIGNARLLFDRFSYLHIPLSYTTFRQQLTGYHTANIFQSLTWWTHCTAQDLLKKFFAERERKTLHDMQNLSGRSMWNWGAFLCTNAFTKNCRQMLLAIW